MHAISATNVTKRYGEVTALDGLTLSVQARSTFGLLGTNGAGKTTLFKLLVGHTTPDEGTLTVSGRDVATAGPDVRRDVGYLPENAGFPSSLSAREVLTFHARMRGLPTAQREDRIADVLATVGLTDAADRAVEGYSNGMNRRLGLATALLPRPRVLLLDEPTAGLDPLGVAAFHRIVRRLREEDDLTVVLSSHVLNEVEELCDSVAVLHDGRLRSIGDLDDLRGSGDAELTVTVRFTDTTAVSEVIDLEATGACTIREADGRRVVFTCPPSCVPDLLVALTGTDRVAGYEVTEPGIERVFKSAVEEEWEGTSSPEGERLHEDVSGDVPEEAST